MSDLFDEDDDLVEESFEDENDVELDKEESSLMDARRRLEQMLEEKRLRDELDDFVDY
ncbi:PA3496 family putative envelope integrity protein [Legionella dresdenensis]|uniref:PA3496 family putative envelope integrity protein n=1 Tax=Legionella dresdenensis TaxID=450200 RepID=A0ABV8CET0_9GAMM